MRLLLIVPSLCGALIAAPAWAQRVIPTDVSPAAGPVQIQQQPESREQKAAKDDKKAKRARGEGNDGKAERDTVEPWVLPLSEFERHVTRLAATAKTERDLKGEPIEWVRRYGSELLWAPVSNEGEVDQALVADDYIVGPGDELIVDIWGSVSASLRAKVSQRGTLSLPRIGSVGVAGVRFADLPKALRARVGEQFRNFEVAVSLGEIRQVRVFVTGFVVKPGVHLVSAAAGITQALAAAGGPSAVGSMRQVQLRRKGVLVETLDLYDLLLRGDLSTDPRLQAGDVLHVPAVGPQVAVIGSVNSPAVFELKGEESVADLLRMAGGLAPVANREQAAVVGLGRNAPARAVELSQAARLKLQAGEVLRIHNVSELNLPALAGARRIRVEGEVKRPGDYVLPAQATLRDAVAAAGGITPQAYLFGSEFNRESVRLTQQDAYDRSLRELEAEFTRAAVTRRERLGPPGEQSNPAQPLIHARIIERLRQVQPTGRIVLQLQPDATELPAIPLEDGDRLLVPSRSASVHVYGSVFNTGSFLYQPGTKLGDYLKQAGGATRNADSGEVFVLRADGSVVSARQAESGWWRQGLQTLPALPGDTVFMPEELDKIRWSTALKDWAQIVSQFGLGAVALKNLTQ
ncbi:MAG: SLBB domain-containing protein [Inhella sp.]|uniref:SLBB domain-containing protein n=3 Tax=Inhella sp. TaxID=1921806 RepID=UPI0022BB7E34|nr:SLBB domain-containing protein [Inhella sp.]MCZ8234439.1 SLBB domain-containing protein [Inhella sp.]